MVPAPQKSRTQALSSATTSETAPEPKSPTSGRWASPCGSRTPKSTLTPDSPAPAFTAQRTRGLSGVPTQAASPVLVICARRRPGCPGHRHTRDQPRRPRWKLLPRLRPGRRQRFLHGQEPDTVLPLKSTARQTSLRITADRRVQIDLGLWQHPGPLVVQSTAMVPKQASRCSQNSAQHHSPVEEGALTAELQALS